MQTSSSESHGSNETSSASTRQPPGEIEKIIKFRFAGPNQDHSLIITAKPLYLTFLRSDLNKKLRNIHLQSTTSRTKHPLHRRDNRLAR